MTVEPISADPRLRQLKAIPRLAKPHMTCPLAKDAITNVDDPVLNEVVRIMGSVCLSGRWYTDDTVQAAATLADRHDAKIDIEFSPYIVLNGDEHKAQVKDLSTPTNDAVVREQVELVTRLAALRSRLGSYIDKPIDHVLVDCELWRGTSGSPEESANRELRYDFVQTALRHLFGPDLGIVWYDSGAKQVNHGDNWLTSPNLYFADANRFDVLCPSAYYPLDLLKTLEAIHHTAQIKDVPIFPWVSLGASCIVPHRPHDDPRAFQVGYAIDFDYPYYYSWHLGQMLCGGAEPERYGERYAAALKRVKGVVFYPAALNPATPQWLDHFIAYCHGAMNQYKDWLPAGAETEDKGGLALPLEDADAPAELTAAQVNP